MNFLIQTVIINISVVCRQSLITSDFVSFAIAHAILGSVIAGQEQDRSDQDLNWELKTAGL